MSIHFWKYVNERYKYLNWRLCIPLWMCLGLKYCTDIYIWLWAKGMWYGLAFDGIHHFSNICVLVGLVLGFYAASRVHRYDKRMIRERHEREIRELREYQQRLRAVQ